MSASWPDSMRGPRAKTPRLRLLLLLLLLLNALTGTVLCQETEGEPEAVPEDGAVTEEPVVSEEAGNLEDPGDTGETQTEPPPIDFQTSASTATPLLENGPPDEATIDPDVGSGSGPEYNESPTGDPEEDALSPIIILIPVVLVVVIIGMIVCGIFINRRWNNKARSQELNKEDPYLDGSSTEKVPMPMFEEDVPSVLELEMEELDQWMKKEDETAEDSKVA